MVGRRSSETSAHVGGTARESGLVVAVMGPAPERAPVRGTPGELEITDPIMEDMEPQENKDAPPSKKHRKGAQDGGLLLPVELSQAQLYKEPTNEELSQMKETENLFHSNLLRMQMEELLKEVRLKEKKQHRIDTFLHEIKQRILSVPSTKMTDMTDQSWLPKGVRVPFIQKPFAVKGRFHFLPPTQVTVVGSYLLGTCVRPDVNVDVVLTMPKEILQDKDGLNQRYLRKRALYIAYLGYHLSRDPLFGSVCFSYINGCHLKPLLLLCPAGKDEHLVTVRLYPCPPPEFFRLCRLLPSKNNVRTTWFWDKSIPEEGVMDPPTPHYNTLLLFDEVLESHLHLLSAILTSSPGLRDGIILLKVWLRQRDLDKGTGGFSGFIISMLVAFLVSTRKINKSMSGYQVLRNVLQFLAATDLTVNGISLCRSSDPSLPAVADFHQAFSVVFLDASGHLNLCADVTVPTYQQVQHEAQLSMAMLDDKTADGFQMLLMTPKSMIRTFDHVLHIYPLSCLYPACQRLKLWTELQDHGGDYVAAILPTLTALLEQGLGSRLTLLAHSRTPVPQWKINQNPPKHKDQGALSLGLLLRPEGLVSILEMGPEADHPEAADFRQFWGSRSELRRFQDGSIREAVLWNAESMAEKRLLPHQVITHLLKLHAGIPESCIHYMGGCLDPLIRAPKEAHSTGEEALAMVVRSYDHLSRQLWSLKGLPLTVSSVQGAHAALRYTAVFSPVPVHPDFAFHDLLDKRKALLPRPSKPCPAFVDPINVVCHLEGSGQWPQEADAIQRVRAAFQLRLAEVLSQEHGLLCSAKASHTDVYKDGYVFRIRVAYHREPQILKESCTPGGMITLRETPASLLLDRDTRQLPQLTSALHGLQQQHSAFSGVARLAKRWVRAQLLSDGLTDECLDLLAASLFLHPFPFTPPSSPQVGFLRFLSLLSTFDWKNSPLIVNLNGELTAEDQAEIHSRFLESRIRLPVMVIATPQDRSQSLWTKDQPSAQILHHLVSLAAKALPILEKQLMDPSESGDTRMVFRPALDIYDVLIRLNARHIPRHREAVDLPATSFSRGLLASSDASPRLPVLCYDPPSLYLAQLRKAFGDLALFFYDQHGGEVIGVLWRPDGFKPQPFKAAGVQGRMVVSQNGDLVTVPNVEAILEDFAILGKGLVQTVEPRSEKWVV
ncbi:nucleolar protein 6 isoform X1 [Monodelphis domestica]|uniref:nucleolar protein 6 isoform X1 n=2 Tax=Monodelphis domestica TaxID=13616 RepID=UPI0024E1DE7A|nr:nucleolar protein 6 isoform X1 [Monodelphis domestica]